MMAIRKSYLLGGVRGARSTAGLGPEFSAASRVIPERLPSAENTSTDLKHAAIRSGRRVGESAALAIVAPPSIKLSTESKS
jgi:hypothetical protein